MQTLQINKENARKLYPSASAEFKTMLVDTFGKEFFSQKITDRVKTFEDACEVLGVRFHASNTDDPDDEAYKKLKIIILALNEGWKPNWNNGNEYKYYPWFYMDKSNGFSLLSVTGACTGSSVGSRLCFKSRELAEYAAKQFIELYKQFFTL
jgi:hypothetical protein